MNRSRRKLLALASLAALFVLIAPTVAAQEEKALPEAWRVGISFSSSITAIGCSIVAVLELSVYPKTYWMLNAMAGVLLLIGFSVSEFRSLPFWVSAFSALIVAIVAVSVSFTRMMAERLVWG